MAATKRDIDLDMAHRADTSEALGVEKREELGLHGHLHLSNLVEEDGATIGFLDQPNLCRQRASEGAALVAEELGFRAAHRGSPHN